MVNLALELSLILVNHSIVSIQGAHDPSNICRQDHRHASGTVSRPATDAAGLGGRLAPEGARSYGPHRHAPTGCYLR